MGFFFDRGCVAGATRCSFTTSSTSYYGKLKEEGDENNDDDADDNDNDDNDNDNDHVDGEQQGQTQKEQGYNGNSYNESNSSSNKVSLVEEEENRGKQQQQQQRQQHNEKHEQHEAMNACKDKDTHQPYVQVVYHEKFIPQLSTMTSLSSSSSSSSTRKTNEDIVRKKHNTSRGAMLLFITSPTKWWIRKNNSKHEDDDSNNNDGNNNFNESDDKVISIICKKHEDDATKTANSPRFNNIWRNPKFTNMSSFRKSRKVLKKNVNRNEEGLLPTSIHEIDEYNNHTENKEEGVLIYQVENLEDIDMIVSLYYEQVVDVNNNNNKNENDNRHRSASISISISTLSSFDALSEAKRLPRGKEMVSKKIQESNGRKLKENRNSINENVGDCNSTKKKSPSSFPVCVWNMYLDCSDLLEDNITCDLA
jgi:hypothetical protein